MIIWHLLHLVKNEMAFWIFHANITFVDLNQKESLEENSILYSKNPLVFKHKLDFYIRLFILDIQCRYIWWINELGCLFSKLLLLFIKGPCNIYSLWLNLSYVSITYTANRKSIGEQITSICSRIPLRQS